MKHLRWFTLALALCLGVGALTTPADAATGSGATGTKAGKKSPVVKKHTPVKLKTTASRKTSVKKAALSNSKKRTSEARKSRKSSKLVSTRAASKKHSRTQKKIRRADPQVWLDHPGESELLRGQASWYGKDFHGGKTASGVPYDMYSYTAAHRTLPLGTVVKVTDEKTGRSVMVCINNRGPFSRGRVIDLSYAAAEEIGLKERGVAPVNLEVVSNAEGKPLKEDEAFYVKLSEESAEEAVVGPFTQYADASVMQEVMRGQHPGAAIVLGPNHTSRN